MAAESRRVFTDDFKKKYVEKVLNSNQSLEAMIEKDGIASSVVRRWLRDSRYGGDAKWCTRSNPLSDVRQAYRKSSGTERLNGVASLPTEPGRKKATRLRPLIPASYICPHCGGGLEVPK